MLGFSVTASGFIGSSSLRQVKSVRRRRTRQRYNALSMIDAGPRIGSVLGSKSLDAKRKSDAFEAWLLDNRMYLSKQATWGRPKHGLAIANETTDEGEPSGRGLVAVKALVQGELLFQVPVSCIITKEKALKIIKQLPEDLDDYMAIAILLVKERSLGEKSFWKPYFDIIPADEELMPLFRWRPEDMELLKGSPSLVAAQSLSMKIESEFNNLEETLFSLDRVQFPEDVFNLASWEWAFAILLSRAVLLPKENLIALVPYADLLNHNPFCSTYIDIDTAMITKDRFVTLYTDRPYGKMSQVFVTYGPKSNSELLVQYGFVVDRNPYDCVDITVSVSKDDPLWERKMEYLKNSRVRPASRFPLYRDRYPMELIEFLRFCVANENEMDTADFGDFISTSNETLVANALIDACRDAIAGYPQTMQEDEALMADRRMYQMLDQKNRWAIRQRLSEKRILARTILNIEREIADPTFMFTSSGE